MPYASQRVCKNIRQQENRIHKEITYEQLTFNGGVEIGTMSGEFPADPKRFLPAKVPVLNTAGCLIYSQMKGRAISRPGNSAGLTISLPLELPAIINEPSSDTYISSVFSSGSTIQ
jgi:hypothetical protein